MMLTNLNELRARLDSLPPRPWRIDGVSTFDVGGREASVGAIRANDNRNVIEPSPESSSMLVALTDVMEFIKDSPEIIEELLNRVSQD